MSAIRVAVLIAVVGFACGCTKSNSPGANGETHFLSSCSGDQGCDDGLRCICGVCTSECEGVGECRALHPAATCGATDTQSPSCETDAPAEACSVTCSEDADCDALGGAFACVGGECTSLAASTARDGGMVTDAYVVAESCPPDQELFAPTHVFDDMGIRIDTNMNPNDRESDTFVDRNGDGMFDDMDAFDFDMDGRFDDFNGDGIADNRFYFDDRAAFVPDDDSFDDYENPGLGIPRGRTPVPGNCPGDGIETGPLDLTGQDGLPFRDWRPSRCCPASEAP